MLVSEHDLLLWLLLFYIPFFVLCLQRLLRRKSGPRQQGIRHVMQQQRSQLPSISSARAFFNFFFLIAVLIIDPVLLTTDTTSLRTISGTGKWNGGVLAKNGLIYGVHCSNIDFFTDRFHRFLLWFQKAYQETPRMFLL